MLYPGNDHWILILFSRSDVCPGNLLSILHLHLALPYSQLGTCPRNLLGPSAFRQTSWFRVLILLWSFYGSALTPDCWSSDRLQHLCFAPQRNFFFSSCSCVFHYLFQGVWKNQDLFLFALPKLIMQQVLRKPLLNSKWMNDEWAKGILKWSTLNMRMILKLV